MIIVDAKLCNSRHTTSEKTGEKYAIRIIIGIFRGNDAFTG